MALVGAGFSRLDTTLSQFHGGRCDIEHVEFLGQPFHNNPHVREVACQQLRAQRCLRDLELPGPQVLH